MKEVFGPRLDIWWETFFDQTLIFFCDNTMNESFKWTDTVFRINQVNIVTMNILELDVQCR